MKKIWLKSVDPNRQCCGCEGKTGPCDSCCAPIIVDLPRLIGIPSAISQEGNFKPFEKYYDCKIYSSSFDSWFISTNSLIGNLDSSKTEEVASHSNEFKISMNAGDTLVFNVSPKLGLTNRPVYASYNGNLNSFVYEVEETSSFEVNISFGEGISSSDFTTVQNNIEKVDQTVALTFRKSITLEGSIRPPVQATQNNGDILIFGCPNLFTYPIGVTYTVSDSSFLTQETVQIGTINRSYQLRSSGWELAGLSIASTDCSFFDRIDECRLLDGNSVIYGIIDQVDEPNLPDPSGLPLGSVYAETNVPYFYIFQYREIDYFSGEKTENSTFSITANKNACIKISANGIFASLNAGGSEECFSDDIMYTQMGMSISSAKTINLIKLSFSTSGEPTPCPET